MLLIVFSAFTAAQSPDPQPRRLSLQRTPLGLVYVSQRVDVARQLGTVENIATLDGEPLPLIQSRNITLGVVMNDQGYVLTRLSGVTPDNPPQEVEVYTSMSPHFSADFVGMDTVTGMCILKMQVHALNAPVFARADVLPVRGMATMYGFNAQLRPSPNILMNRPRIESNSCRLVKAIKDFRYSSGTPIYYLARPDMTPVQDGSVVVTENGDVFGIAVYDISGEGNHLVYPITRLLNLAQNIIKANDSIAHGWLGATGADLTMAPVQNARMPVRTQSNFEPGVRIEGVFPDSPADEAGVQLNDILLKVGGRRITSLVQLGDTLRQLPADSEITLQVRRGNQYKLLQAKLTLAPGTTPEKQLDAIGDRVKGMEQKLGELPQTDPRRKDYEAKVLVMRNIYDRLLRTAAPSEVRLKVLYGLEVGAESLPTQLKSYFGTKGNVLLSTVHASGRAAKAGLRAGDVIIKVGDTEVTDRESFLKALDEKAFRNEPIELLITRQREQLRISFPN